MLFVSNENTTYILSKIAKIFKNNDFPKTLKKMKMIFLLQKSFLKIIVKLMLSNFEKLSNCD
jgi:mannitol/fructose-specific phosphotransferase system IIA component (Ntr-type)